jgi:hypothetical protein
MLQHEKVVLSVYLNLLRHTHKVHKIVNRALLLELKMKLCSFTNVCTQNEVNLKIFLLLDSL